MTVTAEGFDQRRRPSLFDFLNVSVGQIAEIKHTIQTLTSTALDIDHQAQYQSNELSGIEDRLRTLFPAAFDSPQKLAFARQVAMGYHREARRRRRRRLALRSGHRDNVPTGCNTSGKERYKPWQPISLGVDSQMQAAFTCPPQRRALVDHRHLSLRCSSDAQYYEPPPPQPRSRDTGINGPSCRPSFNHDQSPQVEVPVCEPIMTSRAPDHSTGITTISSRSPISYIHRFLQDCSPPLDHLLSRFVELGFQTQGILREVACVWTIEERRELMRRLAPGPNGNKMTEVELVALERGFQALRSPELQ